jgi:Activator of Hsp90 ATPase homolog 1-like protein
MSNLVIRFGTTAEPARAFELICNVRSWWDGEIVGQASQVGDEFSYSFKDLHKSVQRVDELVAGRTIAWRVLSSHLSFARPHDEWTGTRIVFQLEPLGRGARLVFTHQGLTPDRACWNACSRGWEYYVGEVLKRRLEACG